MNSLLVILSLHEFELICFRTNKYFFSLPTINWFQVLQIQTTLFNVNYFLDHNEMVSSIARTNIFIFSQIDILGVAN